MKRMSNSLVRGVCQPRLTFTCDKTSITTQDLDSDGLIKEVLKSKAIWKTPRSADGEWKVISKKYELSLAFLKQKWKSLRKNFREELKKIPRNGKSEYLQDPHVFPSKWRYYRSMLFLVDRVRLPPISEIPVKTKNKESSSRASSSHSIQITGKKRRLDNVDSTNDDETVNSVDANVVNDQQKHTKNDAEMESQVKESTEKANEAVKPDVFEKQIPAVPTVVAESDYLYLMSLHDSLRKVHPSRKLYVRSLFQYILHEELTHFAK